MALRSLTPELAEMAREKFDENPEKLQGALQQIKDWLALQPHIQARTDDQWLAAYIRLFMFDFNEIKTNLDLFYTLRRTASEFFQLHHKDAKFRELIESGFYLPLPKLSDPCAPRVCLIRTGVIDMSESSKVVNALSAAHIIDKILALTDDNAVIAGNIVVLDYNGTDLLHMFRMSANQAKMIVNQKNALPFITYTLFGINLPKGLAPVLRLNELICDNNTKTEQIYLYTDDYEEIYTKHGLSKDIMPTEYGGNGGTLKEITDHWKEKIEQYSEWLEEDLHFGTDESKRPGGPHTPESLYGRVHSMDTLFKPLELLFNQK